MINTTQLENIANISFDQFKTAYQNGTSIAENYVPPPIKESRFSSCNARYNWTDIGGINHGQEAF